MRFRMRPITGAAMMALLASVVVYAQNGIDLERYAKVKAGMVLNFARYTTWPATSFKDEHSPLVITLLGRDPMETELERITREVQVHGRWIELRRIDHWGGDLRSGGMDQEAMERFHERLRESHLLYIASSYRYRCEDVLDELEGADILTVSDIGGFAREGGMLGLAVRGGRVAFDANLDEIEETGLKVSSRLLRLAGIVKTRKREQ